VDDGVSRKDSQGRIHFAIKLREFWTFYNSIIFLYYFWHVSNKTFFLPQRICHE
jgi:hypothetical protein